MADGGVSGVGDGVGDFEGDLGVSSVANLADFLVGEVVRSMDDRSGEEHWSLYDPENQ